MRVVEEESRENVLFPQRAGEVLRAARLKSGLDLSDVATRTRIPLRHLQGIESGDYSGLPSPTYAIGFAKSYARTVDVDGNEVARILRDEIGQKQPGERDYADLEDTDPSRLPGRKLAWTAALVALLIVGGYALWRSYLVQDPAPTVQEAASESEEAVPADNNSSAPAATPAAPATGVVVLTAKDKVWLRIYDAKDKVLFEKEMAAGEQYQVPTDADGPMIRTGRADLISVTVGGREVPTLGPAERTVKDVGVSAAALAARPPAAPAPAPAADGNGTAANLAPQP